jgi:hypothetical protein
MNFRNRICKALFCTILAFASVGGVPMRAEEIEELMRNISAPAIAHTLPEDDDSGDDPIKKLLERTPLTPP